MHLLLFLLVGLHVAGQRVVPSQTSFSLATGRVQAPGAFPAAGKTFSIGGGEFRFRQHDRIGFEGILMNTMMVDTRRIQKNAMALFGFGVMLYKIKGFTVQISASQGFDMKQSIERSTRHTRIMFDGLVPVFALSMGLDYKINRHIGMFTKLRWIGGDISEQGTADYRYGQLVFHTGIYCKMGKKAI